MNNGACLRGVAIGISNQLQLFVVEVTPVDERIMGVRLKHTHILTEMFETEE